MLPGLRAWTLPGGGERDQATARLSPAGESLAGKAAAPRAGGSPWRTAFSVLSSPPPVVGALLSLFAK